MSSDSTDAGLPSLLVQAARSAAEADGLANPLAVNDSLQPSVSSSHRDESAAAVAALASIGAAEKKDSAVAAMERAARNAIVAADGSVKVSATAGSAAHMLASGAPSSLRKSPGNSSSGGGSSKKKGPPLRRGKWTPEEEAYANRLIQEFKAGLLPLTDGTTLRTFLSKLLNCDPMRISKKFVGSNCIGKQVFRRRTADINRLTPDQIQQSRAELSELERRFLERVAQTNRVKSSGVGAGTGGGGSGGVGTGGVEKVKDDMDNSPPSPPWLKPPLGYKQGNGAAMAAAALAGGRNSNNRAAAAGRALLQGMGSSDLKAALERKSSNPSLSSRGSAGLLAMADAHRRTSRQNLLSSLDGHGSANNLLAAAAAARGGSGLSGSAMAQIARNASAARLAGLTAAGSSMNNLLLKSGLSRDQLTQIAREGGMSSASLTNMMDRQSSFDALMSLDLQSLQSIDNLANLIQSGNSLPGQVPQSGMKNWSADAGLGGSPSSSNLAGATGSSGNLADLASARRLASVGRMESLLRSLSNQNMKKSASSSGTGGGSNANFNNLLQSMQSNLNNLAGSGGSSGNLLGSGSNASALSLANMLRADSSTGLTALRMQDGLDQRNSSVEDFLSLVAAGDIPHQDPSLLNVPLMQQQQGGQSGAQAAATLLAQQQLLAQAVGGSSNSALANALASRSGSLSNLRNSSAASLLSGRGNGSAASLLAQHNARSALSGLGGSSSALKRKLLDLDGAFDNQGHPKR